MGLSPKLERVSNCMCGSIGGGGGGGDELVGMEIRKSLNWAWRKSKDNARRRMAICLSSFAHLQPSQLRRGRAVNTCILLTEIKILRSSMDEISCRTDHTL